MSLLSKTTILFCLALLAGCGGVYQPSRNASFALDRESEINDDDVRKAFEARPQLPAKFSVAYYTFDEPRKADIEQMLKLLPGVTSVYGIPALVTTGQRRFERRNSWEPTPHVSIKKLRLLAARARADVLIIVDAGYKTGGANGLAAFNALLVPALFLPFLDNTVASYLEAYVFDTRNGYLYGHLVEDARGGSRYATIYAGGTQPVIARQWAAVRTKMRAKLTTLLSAERLLSKKPATTAHR